jgi:hypothetical protein
MMLQKVTVPDQTLVTDTFVTDLAEIEYVGSGNFRCIFVTEDHGTHIVTVKIIASSDAIKRGIFTAARALGMSIVAELTGAVAKRCH